VEEAPCSIHTQCETHGSPLSSRNAANLLPSTNQKPPASQNHDIKRKQQGVRTVS
jgi:hypothetical protein